MAIPQSAIAMTKGAITFPNAADGPFTRSFYFAIHLQGKENWHRPGAHLTLDLERRKQPVPVQVAESPRGEARQLRLVLALERERIVVRPLETKIQRAPR